MNQGKICKTFFYEYYAVFLTICIIPSLFLFINLDFFTFAVWANMFMFFILFIPYIMKERNIVGLLYCGAIIIGFLFHKIEGLDAKLFGEVLIRIVPILIIIRLRHDKCYSNKFVNFFIVSFYVAECLIAIYEKLTLTHLFDYDSETQAMNVNMNFSEEFRSFSLFGHPLHNANVVSVMLAFIFCSSSIKVFPKIVLVLLGLGAIWSFNSRAAMMIWLFFFFFRLFFYEKGLSILFLVIPLIIVLPTVFIYVQKTGVLGRLDFDFSDGSTLTRILAFEIFFSHPWSLLEMVMGGTILEYPTGGSSGIADYVYIENGYLFDLGYWGFLLGTIKILGEIVISYQALNNYSSRDKIIIMIAMWGIASMNNNTSFTFLMPFYLSCILAFGRKKSIIIVGSSDFKMKHNRLFLFKNIHNSCSNISI